MNYCAFRKGLNLKVSHNLVDNIIFMSYRSTQKDQTNAKRSAGVVQFTFSKYWESYLTICLPYKHVNPCVFHFPRNPFPGLL